MGVAVHESAAVGIRLLSRAPLRALLTVAVLALGYLLCADDADARLAGRFRLAGGSPIGLSRVTATETREDEISPCAAQPAYPVGSLGGLFNRPGLMGGFAAGFLGAGVFGVLFGRGAIGELSSVPSIVGLLFQLGLLLVLARLIWTWWRADKAAAAAELSPRQLADAYGSTRNEALPAVDAEAEPQTAVGMDTKEIFADKKQSRF
jgi:predicted lipid-binding transport protein (Tim44 family)